MSPRIGANGVSAFQIYFEATDADQKDEKLQCSISLHVVGEEALEDFNTFVFSEAQGESKHTLASLYDKKYCNPLKNVTFEIHKFFTRAQGTEKTVDQYVTDLKIKARTCEFGEICESLIKDRIVCGITSDQVRERLSRDSELTLKRAWHGC